MRLLPTVRVSDINLAVISNQALITTIDIFRFVYKEHDFYISVELECSEGYEPLDDINVFGIDIEVKDLERMALNWIFKHVELVEEVE